MIEAISALNTAGILCPTSRGLKCWCELMGKAVKVTHRCKPQENGTSKVPISLSSLVPRQTQKGWSGNWHIPKLFHCKIFAAMNKL